MVNFPCVFLSIHHWFISLHQKYKDVFSIPRCMRQFTSVNFFLVTFPLGLNIDICIHMHTIWKGKGENNVYVRIKGLGDRGGSEDILLTLYPSLKCSYMFLYDVVPLPCSYRIRSLSIGLGQQVVEKFEYIIHFKKEINNMHPQN